MAARNPVDPVTELGGNAPHNQERATHLLNLLRIGRGWDMAPTAASLKGMSQVTCPAGRFCRRWLMNVGDQGCKACPPETRRTGY